MSKTKGSSQKSPESQVTKEESRIETRFFTITIILTAILFSAVGAVTYWNISRKQDNNSKPSPKTNCIYNNATYDDGDTFQSTDGCNTCTCQGGKVACTEMACIDEDEDEENKKVNTPNPYKDWQVYKYKPLNFSIRYPQKWELEESAFIEPSDDEIAFFSISNNQSKLEFNRGSEMWTMCLFDDSSKSEEEAFLKATRSATVGNPETDEEYLQNFSQDLSEKDYSSVENTSYKFRIVENGQICMSYKDQFWTNYPFSLEYKEEDFGTIQEILKSLEINDEDKFWQI